MLIRDFADKYIKAELDAFQKSEFEALAELEHANVVYHVSPLGDMKGHESHKQYILGVTMGVSNLKQELNYLGGEGNLFILTYKAGGLITGEKPGFPPAIGKKIALDYLFVIRVEKGKVAEAWANGTLNLI
jgi:hypothetical protein